MKIVAGKPCVALVSIWGSLLVLGVALAENSTASFQHPPAPMAPKQPSVQMASAQPPVPMASKHQVRRNFGSRARFLTTTTVWCIALSTAPEANLQGALDWACGTLSGQGQVNCAPISAGGTCFDPDTRFHHASYAFNEYFQRNNEALTACDFSGTATITTVDPSQGTCHFSGSNAIVGPNITVPAPAPSPGSTQESPNLVPQASAGSQIEPSFFTFFFVSTVVTLAAYILAGQASSC